tara:strand:- start:58 stop:534 length:477 start_codon:yes stop_codon:yes gene_type:complete
MKDYYSILEIDKNATKEEIKSAYKKMALKYHPDKNQHNKDFDVDQFKEISEAYEVLSDEQKKLNYDNGNNIIIHNHNPFDIFENIFNHRHHHQFTNVNHLFNNNFDININNLSSQCTGTSINTSTTIHGNKKITRIQKTQNTPNGPITSIEERIEIIN